MTELNSIEKIKHNMEIAMEWMSKLDYRISSVSVYDFGIYLIVEESSIEFLHKVLETAEEKEVSLNVARNSDSGFIYCTSDEIGLNIIFTENK